jgi:RNA polymerase sigma-70 factor (ECF subfamily)
MVARDFEQVVRDHQAAVFRLLARLVGSRDVEDAAQEVFLRLYRALPHFRGDAKLSTYVYRIALNVAHDERSRRRDAARRSVSLSDPDARWDDRLAHGGAPIDRVLEDRERWEAMQEGLGMLSDRERSALVLYHQEERSYAEIGAIMELPINTVRTHLHRGRQRLAQIIAERLARR